MNREDVKKLETWMTIPEAIEVLGVTKQAIHKMLWEQNLFLDNEVRQIGASPIYLLDAVAVYELRDIRRKSDEIRKARKRMAARQGDLRTQF